jgi:hypothetical protein
MEPLTKTVTMQVKVDSRIADLVYFVKALRERHGAHIMDMRDDELVASAEDFWDTRHGED